MLSHGSAPWAIHDPSLPFRIQIIPNTDVVVGDVMLIDTGDKIIADGIMVEGHHLVRWWHMMLSGVGGWGECPGQGGRGVCGDENGDGLCFWISLLEGTRCSSTTGTCW